MTEQPQPNALRLADWIDSDFDPDDMHEFGYDQIATELRSQHAENVRLRAAERTLGALGYTDNGGELWKPPLGPAPDFNLLDAKNHRIAELEAQLSQRKQSALTDEQCDRLIAALCPDFCDERFPGDRPTMRQLAREAVAR